MVNPFSLGIVQGEAFCDREQECRDLGSHAKSGDNVVMISPRRFGKSSLLVRLLGNLREEGFATAYIDLFPVSTEQEVVERIARGILSGIGAGADPARFWERVKQLFSRIVPVLEATPDGFNISVKFDRETSTEILLDDIMKGLHSYLAKRDLNACIALDEFQEVTELKGAKKIEGILRSHIQFHESISYMFVGSRRRIMRDIFMDRTRPFYKSAYLYELKEIPKEEFVPYISRRFSGSGKSITSESGGRIYDLVRGYPYYVQKLASIAWQLADTVCDDETIRQAYSSLLMEESLYFDGPWSSLTQVQKMVMKAIAKEPVSALYARDYLARYRLSVGGAQRALKSLIRRDLVEKDAVSGKYRLTDPVMADWLNNWSYSV